MNEEQNILIDRYTHQTFFLLGMVFQVISFIGLAHEHASGIIIVLGIFGFAFMATAFFHVIRKD